MRVSGKGSLPASAARNAEVFVLGERKVIAVREYQWTHNGQDPVDCAADVIVIEG